MKKSRFTDSQIIAVLKQAEAGTPVPELCREHGISSATWVSPTSERYTSLLRLARRSRCFSRASCWSCSLSRLMLARFERTTPANEMSAATIPDQMTVGRLKNDGSVDMFF